MVSDDLELGMVDERGQIREAEIHGALEGPAGGRPVPAAGGLVSPQERGLHPVGIVERRVHHHLRHVLEDRRALAALDGQQRHEQDRRGRGYRAGGGADLPGRWTQAGDESRPGTAARQQRSPDQSGQDRMQIAVAHRKDEHEHLRDRGEGARGDEPEGRLLLPAYEGEDRPGPQGQQAHQAAQPPRVQPRGRGRRLVEGRHAGAGRRHHEVAHGDGDDRARVDHRTLVDHEADVGLTLEGRHLRHRDEAEQNDPAAEPGPVRRGAFPGLSDPGLDGGDGQREDRLDLRQQGQPEEQHRQTRVTGVEQQGPEGQPQGDEGLELEDPAHHLGVGGMDEEEGRAEPCGHAGDGRPSEEGDQQRRHEPVEHGVHDPVPAGAVFPELPLGGVHQQVDRCVVERVDRRRSPRIENRPHVLPGQPVGVGVVHQDQEVVGQEVAVEGGRGHPGGERDEGRADEERPSDAADRGRDPGERGRHGRGGYPISSRADRCGRARARPCAPVRGRARPCAAGPAPIC